MENYSALRKSRSQRKAFLEPGMKISMQFCPSCGHWLSCLYGYKCLLRIVYPLWDGETQPVKGAGILVSKCSCYFWTWLLGFSFPWSYSVYLKHHPFFFYPPFPRFFSSSDVFRCLDFSFSDFEKKKICPYAFEIAIGLQVCPEISKNSSRNYSYSDDEGFIQQIHWLGICCYFSGQSSVIFLTGICQWG